MHISEQNLKKLITGSGIITEAQFDAAVQEAKRSHRTVENVLIGRGEITESYVGELVADYFGIPIVNFAATPVDDNALHTLPEAFSRAKRAAVFALDTKEGTAKVAFEDPGDLRTLSLIEVTLNMRVEPYFATPSSMKVVFKEYKKDIYKEFNTIIEESIKEALEESGKYEVLPVLINKDGSWPVDIDDLADEVDIAFIALHGEYGEDGTVQEVLREAGIPFTGSDVLPSALGMNKILSSRLLMSQGVSVPRFVVVHKHEKSIDPFDHFGFPVVVKPADRGSSVGVSVVRGPEELYVALQNAFRLSKDAIIQEYIPGHEVTCNVLDDGLGDVVPLPVIEIIPRSGGMFDYDAKYTPGASDEIVPARLSDEGTELVQRAAVAAHRAVGASGVSRTDMIIGEDGELYVLEINTIPGMTSTSLLPKAAEAHGLTLQDLFDRIIEAGLRKHGLLLRSLP